MENNMIEFICKFLDVVFPEKDLFGGSPFNVDDLRDCIIMGIIKKAYHEASEKKSLRAHRGKELDEKDDLRMRYVRSLAYAQHYRNLEFERKKGLNNSELDELRGDDMSSMENKIEGHRITNMQYFELQTMTEQPLLKSIINKRICDVKKISNSVFMDYMKEYDMLISYLINQFENDDEDVIFATIALFTLEWKYNVELFYNCAVEAEKNKNEEVPTSKLGLLCADLVMPTTQDQFIHTQSRFIFHRLKLIPFVYSDSYVPWAKIEDKLWRYLSVQYYIDTAQIDNCSMSRFFVDNFSRKDWADFIKEHYDLRKIYRHKEWTNKRIRYVRKLYNKLYIDSPNPNQ